MNKKPKIMMKVQITLVLKELNLEESGFWMLVWTSDSEVSLSEANCFLSVFGSFYRRPGIFINFLWLID